MPYRFPTWANGTAALNAQKNTDAEISFEYSNRMTKAAWERYVRNGRNPAVYTPSRRALEYRLPTATRTGPTSAWAGVLRVPLRALPRRPQATGRCVDGFELVNEPNLQLWPQQAAAAGAADPFAKTRSRSTRSRS